MKNHSFLTLILTSLFLVACSATVDQANPVTTTSSQYQQVTTPQPAQSTMPAMAITPQRTLLQRQPAKDENLTIEFPGKFVSERLAKAENSRIGLYAEQELLFGQDYVSLGNDVGYSAKLAMRNCYLENVVREFPEAGVRDMGDYVYLMYDTDKQNRLYLYYPKREGQLLFNNGYPILMRKTLAYEQYTILSVGDSIQKVGQIDPVIPLYIQKFDKATDAALELTRKEGIYLTSVHLLSDGILKIEYERTKEKDYVIHSLVFRDDFTLDGFDGKTCYRILKEDYVSADSK